MVTANEFDMVDYIAFGANGKKNYNLVLKALGPLAEKSSRDMEIRLGAFS